MTARNQSLEELLAKVPHHNGKTRREALLGVKELAERFPENVSRKLSALLPVLLGALYCAGQSETADEALLQVLSLVFSRATMSEMTPHSSLVWAYLSSALTHLSLFSRLLGLKALTAALANDAILLACEEKKMLAALTATLTDRFQSGVSAKSETVRSAVWEALLAYQTRKNLIIKRREEEGKGAQLFSCSAIYAQHSRKESAQFDQSLLRLLLAELHEHVPGNAFFANGLLKSLALLQVGPDLRVLFRACLAHLAAHFPLAAADESGEECNVRVAALLLEDGSECDERIAQFVSANLARKTLAIEWRRILLRACCAMWRTSGLADASSPASVLAQEFAVFFRARLAENVCAECVAPLDCLLSLSSTPVALRLDLLRSAARILFRSSGSSGSSGSIMITLASYLRRRPPAAEAHELLSNLLVPVLFWRKVGEKSVSADSPPLTAGSFFSFPAPEQVLFVQLFSGIAEPISAKLSEALLKTLGDERTSVAAAETLVLILRMVGGKAFASLAEYYSFLGKALFRQPCAVSHSVIRAIGDAVGLFADSQNGHSRNFALLAFEEHLAQLLKEGGVKECENAMLFLRMVGGNDLRVSDVLRGPLEGSLRQWGAQLEPQLAHHFRKFFAK